MKYNFDEVIERRGTNSTKWDPGTLREKFGEPDALPFWVADMDFRVAQPIIDAIEQSARHGIFGYSKRPESYFEAVADWVQRRFHWPVQREWLEHAPGVVPAVNYLVQAFCQPGDSVLIQEPVYYPFARSIKNNGCHVLNNPLIYNGEYYEIDFADFEEKLRDPRVRMFILCSPHNPVSRVWTREELARLGQACLDNNVLVVSDEIHNDLVYPQYRHVMFASLSEEFALNSVTCIAPSKTFNLAGLQTSNIIIPNGELRERYQRVLERHSIDLKNPLSIAGVEAAYRHGEEWLEQLLDYLQGNVSFIKDYLRRHLPKARLIEPQATYLAWIDLREYETDGTRLEEVVAREGKVALDGGTWFGQGGDGFLRLNFACPRTLLEEGLARMCSAVNSMETGRCQDEICR